MIVFSREVVLKLNSVVTTSVLFFERFRRKLGCNAMNPMTCPCYPKEELIVPATPDITASCKLSKIPPPPSPPLGIPTILETVMVTCWKLPFPDGVEYWSPADGFNFNSSSCPKTRAGKRNGWNVISINGVRGMTDEQMEKMMKEINIATFELEARPGPVPEEEEEETGEEQNRAGGLGDCGEGGAGGQGCFATLRKRLCNEKEVKKGLEEALAEMGKMKEVNFKLREEVRYLRYLLSLRQYFDV